MAMPAITANSTAATPRAKLRRASCPTAKAKVNVEQAFLPVFCLPKAQTRTIFVCPLADYAKARKTSGKPPTARAN